MMGLMTWSLGCASQSWRHTYARRTSAVEEKGAATQEIVHNVAQAATGTAEVTSNTAGVAQASEDTGAAATQVIASASELFRQSEHFSNEAHRFP